MLSSRKDEVSIGFLGCLDMNRLCLATILFFSACHNPFSPTFHENSQGKKTVVTNSFLPRRSDRKTLLLGPLKDQIGRLAMPVRVPKLTSKFGWRNGRFHEGLDLSVAEGAKIYAAHAGKIAFISDGFSGYGRTIVVQGEGFMTVYAHNRRNRVDAGDIVERGEWIGDVGQSGDATGPHLHFELRVKDSNSKYSAIDPAVFLPRDLR